MALGGNHTKKALVLSGHIGMRIGHIQGHISIKLLGEGVMKFNQTIVQFNSNYVARTSPELHDNILF